MLPPLSLGRRRSRPGWRSVAGASGTAGAVLFLLLLPPSGNAALWVSIGIDPPAPVAGVSARVSVQMLLVYGADCLDDPRATVTPTVAFTDGSVPSSATMERRATGPGPGDVVTVKVRRRADDPTTWDGRVVFPTAGTWTLQMERPSWPGASGSCSGAEVTVTVRPRPEVSPWGCVEPGSWSGAGCWRW
jgi:hypothetical protein